MQASSPSTAAARPDGAAPSRAVVAALAGAAAWLLLSHWLMLHAADRPWAVAALFGPLLATVAGVAIGRRHRPTLVAALAGAAVLVGVVAAGGLGDVNRLYVAQHAGMHALLGLACIASLRPGRLSWIGQAALRVHGRLTPAMVAYCASVTRVWTAYFLAMALLSVVVYLACAWPTWSALANLATPATVAVLIVGEHLLRYRLHPEFERATLADVARTFRGTSVAAPVSVAPPAAAAEAPPR